jgi:hypothetical protein
MFIPLTVDALIARLLVVGQREKWTEKTIWAQARRPRYKEIRIQKRSSERNILAGGDSEVEPKIRIIHEPSFWLKKIQRYILNMVLEPATDMLMDCVCGCVQGHSIVTNARPHVGARVRIHMDLKDFFPSVSVQRVYTLFYKVFKYETGLAWLLANLCCYLDRLPQGAPTSPMLANMVATPLDWGLTRICRNAGAVYTRYVDDLTFSFRNWVPREFRNEFIRRATRIVGVNGFKVNAEKTGVATQKRRMSVTGVVVNSGLSTPREFRRNLRAAIFNQEAGIPSVDSAEVVRGKLCYVRMVSPRQAISTLGKTTVR